MVVNTEWQHPMIEEGSEMTDLVKDRLLLAVEAGGLLRLRDLQPLQVPS